jgi:hypothetical protein
MTSLPDQVIDTINNIRMPLEQYNKGMDLVDPADEAFTLRAPNRVDTIQLCPWFLNSLLGETDEDDDRLHLTEEDVRDAMQYPSNDAANPDIDALKTLDLVVLHEVKIPVLTLY